MPSKREFFEERILPEGDTIFVGSRSSRISGVAVRDDFPYRPDRDVCGKERIQSDLELFGIERTVNINVKELLHAVHARIGSAASYNGRGFPDQCGKCTFNDLLHTQGVVLTLPTGVARSDIRNLEEIAHISLTLPGS